MEHQLDVDKHNKLITVKIAGEINGVAFKKGLMELELLITLNRGFNILIDTLDASLPKSEINVSRVFDVALSLEKLKDFGCANIASVVEKRHTERLKHAKDVEIGANLKGINYRVFTDKESAVEWLEGTGL